MQYSSNVLNRYKEKSNNIKYIIEEFDLPIFLNRFHLSRAGLILNSKTIKFNKNNWVNNPQQFCLDQYGEYEYYRIILLVNNIRSIFLFNSNYLKNNLVIVPNETSILSILG